MIKASVMYPYSLGARFDRDYYRDKHMPMVQMLLGDGCTYYTIDKGLAGGEPSSKPTYVGACHVFSPSIELFQTGMARHRGYEACAARL